MARIWLALDGVLADVDRSLMLLFGMDRRELSEAVGERVLVKRMNDAVGMWSEVSVIADAFGCVAELSEAARDRGDLVASMVLYPPAAEWQHEALVWSNRWFPAVPVVPVRRPGLADNCARGDVLVSDDAGLAALWRSAGGEFVLFDGWLTTLPRLVARYG